MNSNKREKLIIGITAPLSTILIKGQLQFFSKSGYDVYLLAPKEAVVEELCVDEGCTLLPVNIKREISFFRDIASLYAILKHMYKIKPDILNVGTPKMALLGIIAGYIIGVKKRIYTCRGFRYEHEKGITKAVLIGMEKITSKLSHHIICISKSVMEKGIEDKIFPESKSIVIGKGSSNGVDLQFYNPKSYPNVESECIMDNLELRGKFVFGFVGRIVDRKGINELYEAFTRLYSINFNIHLIIVGKANLEQVSDNTLMSRLESHSAITLTGYIDNVPDYISLFDVFVLPAWWEGFGNTLIQAAAMGVPILSTDVTGCKDAVDNGFNGILIEPKNPERLYEAMKLLLENKEMRDNLGENGIIWARNFDSVELWNSMKELYES